MLVHERNTFVFEREQERERDFSEREREKLLSMAEGNSSGYVPKFVGHYDHWAEMMENLLRSKEYWMVVEHGTEVKIGGETPLLSSIVAETHKLTDAQLKKAQEDNNLKDLKATNLLYQSIEREVLETILDRSSARAI